MRRPVPLSALAAFAVSLGVAFALPADAGTFATGPGTFSPPDYVGVDLAIKPVGGRYSGLGTDDFARIHQYAPRTGSTVHAVAKVCNGGQKVGRVRLKGTSSGARFQVRYLSRSGTDITSRVVAGTYRTRWLPRDRCSTIKITVRRTRHADQGDRRLFVLRAIPQFHPEQDDSVGIVVHAHPPIDLSDDIVTPPRAGLRRDRRAVIHDGA